MTVRELREKYLRFFETKGHLRYPSGSLIPYDVTGRLDESLLFNGAGMIQFKPYFRGVAEPDSKRLTTAQKCVRTGDIEEVGDLTHLTFFEMMGNFSFGDYFKAEAIAYSWEFLTSPEWLALDPRKLTFTVFQEDDQAFDLWGTYIAGIGLDPKTRIFRLGEDTNYWPAGSFSSGPPGPCGPNSEMFYWVADEAPPTGEYSREQWLEDEENGKWVEIWNDVFISYEWQGSLKDPSRGPAGGYIKAGMPDLPFRSIDTGMGLERTAFVLSGKKSVYDNDVFEPIFAKIAELGGPADGPEKTRAFRVIADHIRTASFCIADGVLPGNTGRGYVLRRLIRRAALQGDRKLGIGEPFLYQVFEGVIASMGDFYTELVERKDTIVETLQREEEAFRRTLSQGAILLQQELEGATGSKVLAGETAFRLYDTFGFPLEITIELAQEVGVSVDVDGYEVALKEAQERSRGATDRESVYGGVTAAEELVADDAPDVTQFVGYETMESFARVVRVRPLADDRALVALDVTPFYGESGGQTGDQGTLMVHGVKLDVSNTTKASGIFWHEVRFSGAPDSLLSQEVKAEVLNGRRSRIRRNHTATHLMQAALRQVLGTHVTQAGSYVGPDELRFDFTHGKAMTEEERATVERIVNQQILANTSVHTYVDLPIAEARAKGAMALFGEKYGDRVRMVEVGSFSKELCGGTHVRATGEIGLFKIRSESSAASGVRRIEAITGEGAYDYVLELEHRLRGAAEVLKTSPAELVTAAQRAIDGLRDERRKREKAEMAALRGTSDASHKEFEVGGVKVWVRNFGEVDQDIAAQAVDDTTAQNPNQVTVAAVVSGTKITFLCKCGKEAVAKGAHAGNLLREVSKIAGGGGGGRPEFATAGGKQPEKVDEALAAVESILAKLLG